MEIIEDLSQRIWNIQQCLCYVVSGHYDDKTILVLQSKMNLLDQKLSEMEERIDSQMPIINEIRLLKEEIMDIYNACQFIPDPKPSELNTSIQLPKMMPRQSLSRNEVFDFPSQQMNQSNRRQSIKSTSITQLEESQPDIFIKNITEAELKEASRNITAREKLNVINDWIAEINKILKRKDKLIKYTENKVKSSELQLWKRYKDEEIEGDTRRFFTQEDIRNADTIKGKTMKAINILQSCNRIYCSTDFGVKRYFIK